MRLRKTPHTPLPSSNVYPCGQRPVRLLRGYGVAYPQIQAEVRALVSGELADVESAMITAALHTFALWDDPEVEWAADLDPDAVLDLKGEELVDAGRVLARELFGPSFARLGFDRDVLIQQVIPLAVWGLPYEGNAGPLPTQN